MKRKQETTEKQKGDLLNQVFGFATKKGGRTDSPTKQVLDGFFPY